ncbi:MAG TPA: TRAP transporter substrate-binding protein [Stellaceae bacterium]|nr:TRAP transporter substrate-binding protein [Stellaceae bacterium]
MSRPSRRTLLATAAVFAILPGRARAAEWTARQFHNQPEESHQHRFLVDLWAAVREQTGGRLDVSVHARDGDVAGSDPGALAMLRSGELEFFSLMGGILGNAVPSAEIQGLPFAFTSPEQAYAAADGPLGAYIGRECEAAGIHRFQRGLLENGFRHITMADRPIRTADDLAGMRMRVPDGQMFRDLFTALDAVPVTVNIRELYDSLRDHRVDGQENPLVVTEVNRLYEVTRYLSMTGHMWSGFNELANLAFWRRLPGDVQDVVTRNVDIHVARQRAYTDQLNKELETSLVGRGLVLNVADAGSFRRKLGGEFYARWKGLVGTQAWTLLEDQVGKLG